jgi:hypothetical protein
VCWLLSAAAAADDLAITLASPLTQRIALGRTLPVGACTISAEVEVPETAPADIGVGAYTRDLAGRWRQASLDGPLPPGRRTRIRLRLPPTGLAGGGAVDGELGLQLWASGGSRAVVRLRELAVESEEPPALEPRLLDLGWSSAPWRLMARPSPLPAFGATGWSLDGEVEDPSGAHRVVQARVMAPAPGHPGGAWSLSVLPECAGDHQVAVRAMVAGRVLAGLPDLPVPGADGGAAGGRRAAIAPPLTAEPAVSAARGSQGRRITARLRIGDAAPTDLSATAFVQDGDGRWRLAPTAVTLAPGTAVLAFDVPARRGPAPTGDILAGLALSGARPGGGAVVIEDLAVTDRAAPPSPARLGDAALDGWDAKAGRARGAVGTPWNARVRPLGFAVDSLRCEVKAPDGRSWSVPLAQQADGAWLLCLHPIMDGVHGLRLVAGGVGERQLALPPLEVAPGVLADRGGSRIALAAPLVTRVRIPLTAGATRLHATVVVGDDVPADLGVAAWISDRHGRWYQTAPQGPLAPGVHRLSWPIGADARLQPVGHGARWSAAEAAKAATGGLVLWSARRSPARVVVADLAADGTDPRLGGQPRLGDLSPGGWDPAIRACLGATGERWEVAVRPLPFPANPFDDGEFALDAVITGPDGAERRIPGFFAQDMERRDRGDKEEVLPVPGGSFRVRFRPSAPGDYRVRLDGRWAGGGTVSVALPALRVGGAPWDGYARVDRQDPRFFSVAGNPFWPLGPNLRSVWDVRGRDRMHTRLTPDRGTLAYDAYLDRFAAAGANACEIWLSSWNLALEWRGDWPGFHGIGRFNEENAWRIDQVLDRAWRDGMRVNLVVNNHGQASEHADNEWSNNPWSAAQGGPLTGARQYFTDQRAIAGQERVRRYLVARYADHPAILGWKLWSEQDLTEGKDALPAWHAQATARWRALDTYGHPLTSHWCGDFTHANPAVASSLDYVCVDAYHDWGANDRYRAIADLLRDTTLQPARGLAQGGRPALVTEFGGHWNGAPSDDLMESDHAVGPWIAAMTGHAGAPMLWWFEWIDQGDRWGPYRSLSAFLAGEDLRGATGSVVLGVTGADQGQCVAWTRPGRILGHLLDRGWSSVGGAGRVLSGMTVVVGDEVDAGAMGVEWWDADTGARLGGTAIAHPGGRLALACPPFRRHLAFKLMRAP